MTEPPPPAEPGPLDDAKEPPLPRELPTIEVQQSEAKEAEPEGPTAEVAPPEEAADQPVSPPVELPTPEAPPTSVLAVEVPLHPSARLRPSPGGMARLGFNMVAARATWTVAFVLVVLYTLYQIRETLFIFILAVFFSYMVYPLVAVVQKYIKERGSRTGAIGIVYIAVMSCMVVALMAIGSEVVNDTTELARSLPALLHDPQWVDKLPIPSFLDEVKPKLLDAIRHEAASLSENALPLLQQFGSAAVSYAGNAIFVVLIPILSFLLSKDAPEMRQTLMEWIPDEASRAWWDHVLIDLNVLLAGYIRALLLLSLATFVVFSLFLSVVRAPYGILLAVVAALLEFIPMVGPLTAAALILVVALVNGYAQVGLLVLFLVAYRLFEDYVLSPILMGSGVELNPLLVIFGVLAGEHLGGVPAMVLSIPTLAAVKILAVRLRDKTRTEGDPSGAAVPGG